MNPDRNKILFSPEQVQYLKDLFPVQAIGPDASEAVLRHYMGQQSVVAAAAARCSNPRLKYTGIQHG